MTLSLRARLLLGVLALTALGLAVAGTVGTLALRGYLVDQVDAQLAGAGRFTNGPPAARTPAPGATPGTVAPATTGASPAASSAPSQQPALPSAFVVTRLDAAGAVVEQRRGSQVSDAPQPDLTGLSLAAVTATGGAPFDVGGIDDPSYSYRAVAVPLADGTGSVVLAISTEPIDATTQRVALVAVGVGLLTLGLVALLAGRVVRLGLRPLDDVERTAEHIAAGDLAQRVPQMPPGTELGRLADSLNGMLGQIELAFDERRASEEQLRRFVADASHELRTPLTTIRGYAELTRSGALSGDEVRRAQALARIEEEALRMGVLVDDLLLLARLDQQRPLETAEVDLVPLVRAGAEALRAAAPDRDVTLVAPDHALVAGDGARLRQVVDNLATNARVHTAPGSPVSIRVTVDDGRACLVVRDSGPGMTADEVAHAFERFYRGDPSRTRATGGSGLGLAIVHAIVVAQGGTLELVSHPATGTTVTVTLPLLEAQPGRTSSSLVGAAR